MRNDKFFKHDASAADDEKILILIGTEGLKGYGAYWILLEALRKHQDLRLSFSVIKMLAARYRTRKEYLMHIINDFDLFIIEENHFYSSGMRRRMARYQYLTFGTSVNSNVKEESNILIVSDVDGVHARNEDKIRQDLNLNVVDVNKTEGQNPVEAYTGWEALVDEMAASQDYMNQAGMHSGLGELFIRNQGYIVRLFKKQISLKGKEGKMMNLSEVKSYFSNYIANGSMTNKILRKALKDIMVRQNGQYAYRYENLMEGKRMYLGHIIPNDAPPRPNASAVWDDVKKKWGN